MPHCRTIITLVILLFSYELKATADTDSFDSATQSVEKVELIDSTPQTLVNALSLFNDQRFENVVTLVDEYINQNNTDELWNSLALFLKAEAIIGQGDPATGFNYLDNAVERLSAVDPQRYKGVPLFEGIYSEGASLACILGIYNKSIAYGRQYLELTYSMRDSQEETRKSRIVNAVLYVMTSYRALNQYDEVLDCFKYIKDISAQTVGTQLARGRILQLMADVLLKLRRYDDAIAVATEAVLIIETLAGSQNNFAIESKLILGNAFNGAGKLLDAKEIYSALLPLVRSCADFDIALGIVAGYSNVLSVLGEGDKVSDYVKQVMPDLLALAQNDADRELINQLFSVSQGNLASLGGVDGQIVIVVSDIANKNLDKARDALDLLEAHFTAIGDSTSKSYCNYLNAEMMYNVANGTVTYPEMSQKFIRCLSYNYSPVSESYLEGIYMLMMSLIHSDDKAEFRNVLKLL